MKTFKFRKFSILFLYTTVLLCIIFIPFNFKSSPFKNKLGEILFGDFIEFIWSNFSDSSIVFPISSDAAGMYLLFFLIIVISIILSSLLSVVTKSSLQQRLIKLIITLSTIYISLILFKYGCDKIFLEQFYTPEPNILYTNFGKLDQDILYWSVMGLSWKYAFFLGLIEVFVAIGLLFQKTRVFALFLSLFTITHIVVINFSFDISVKLFSSFLLIINLILIFPFLKRTIVFISGKKVEKLEVYKILPESFNSKTKALLMILILFLIVSEGVAPHINNYKLSRNNSAQYKIHGAFKTTDIDKKYENLGVKRIYFHKNNYIIFHFENDNQIDLYYEFLSDENGLKLILFDYEQKTFRINVMEHNYSELKLQLHGLFGLEELNLVRLEHENLPALQKQFHWSVEGIE